MSLALDDIFGSADPPVKVVPVECPPPGIYYDIPNHVYHSWPALSSTVLKSYAENPATCREPYVPGDDANVGQGIHVYSLLGQEGLDSECILGPKFGKGKADMEEKAALEAANPTKTVLPAYYGSPAPGQPIMEVLRGVDNSLRAHPKVGPMLEHAQREVSVVWIDAGSGCTCKARFDIWDGAILWDLKKTRSIDSFRWQMKDLHYFVQSGVYMEGALAVALPAVAFGFIPMEAFPPYRVSCGYVDPEKMDECRDNARRLIGLFKQSQLTGYWPNFPIPRHCYNLEDIQPDDLVEIY